MGFPHTIISTAAAMAMSTATVLRSTAHRSRQLSSISMAMAMATAKGRSHRGVGTLGDPPAAGGASGGQGQELALMAPPTTASYSSHSSASSSSSSSPSSPSHTAHPHATAGGSAAGPNTSTSQWPTLRRHLHATSRIPAHYSFDTASFVNRLEREGLSRKQSVGIMEALEEVVEESIRTMTANLVTRAEQEKHQYTQKVDFAKLKSEITLLEKQDFSLLKSENERLLSEVERLKQRLREGASFSPSVSLSLSRCCRDRADRWCPRP